MDNNGEHHKLPMNLTILSYNLNGMGNVDTLATIMKKHKPGIILLQETHTDNDNMFS